VVGVFEAFSGLRYIRVPVRHPWLPQPRERLEHTDHRRKSKSKRRKQEEESVEGRCIGEVSGLW